MNGLKHNKVVSNVRMINNSWQSISYGGSDYYRWSKTASIMRMTKVRSRHHLWQHALKSAKIRMKMSRICNLNCNQFKTTNKSRAFSDIACPWTASEVGNEQSSISSLLAVHQHLSRQYLTESTIVSIISFQSSIRRRRQMFANKVSNAKCEKLVKTGEQIKVLF